LPSFKGPPYLARRRSPLNREPETAV